jgi:tripartite-type tricarboxylate transporter receptor subunit TctC
MKFRRQLAALTLAAAALAAHGAYPEKAITMIVPFPAGGPTDLVSRVLGKAMSDSMGQPIVIENRAGANGNIGASLAAKAAPDGYTIFYNTSAVALSPSLYKNLTYDVTKDLSPVALAAVVPLALVVHPSVPANNVKEFIAYVKANPGKLSYGSAGAGNVTHLGAFQFLQANGLEAVHIPYKGSAPADMDLVGGQIQFMTDTVNSVAAFVKDKRMKMLAVTTLKRVSNFPEVPTLAESGMRGFDVGAWQGLMVPAGTPRPVIDRLNVELRKALANPEVRAKLAQQGAETLGSTPEEYGDYIKKEIARWGKVVQQSGVKAE